MAVVVTKVAMKINTPPKRGTLRLWTLRSSNGSSSRFFCTARRISEGMPSITMANAMMAADMIKALIM